LTTLWLQVVVEVADEVAVVLVGLELERVLP
jgi:hypothetical protein